MPIETTYAAIASMDVPAEKDDLFNEIYDEHVTFLLEVPGSDPDSKGPDKPNVDALKTIRDRLGIPA